MPVNPALRQETLTNPIQRGNPLNDPQYQNQQGYNNYDLNNGQFTTPRFGEVTPNCVFETVPGDRHQVHGNALTILNQIDANLCSEVNAYADYFYTPMRCIYPINYEKLIPNPVKGTDLPDKALPMIPLLPFLHRMLWNPQKLEVILPGSPSQTFSLEDADYADIGSYTNEQGIVMLNNVLYSAFILSRGQLLDYLGCSFDDYSYEPNSYYSRYQNRLQSYIDLLFERIALNISSAIEQDGYQFVLYGYDLHDLHVRQGTLTDIVNLNSSAGSKVIYSASKFYDSTDDSYYSSFELSSFRGALYDCFEKGLLVFPQLLDSEGRIDLDAVLGGTYDAISPISEFVAFIESHPYSWPEESADPFESLDFVNPSRIAAYQLSVAEYMSNDTVDNLYTAELYMQNLRALMFPSTGAGLSREKTFLYNGVSTEYDLLTTGAFEYAFFDDDNTLGLLHKMVPFASALFIMRRSLRYGDYFATGRPRLLAVGQLGIPVDNGIVHPIDVTRNLVLQRFLNAVNWVGSRFINYMTSIFGVKPSDTGCKPIFLAHRKTPLQRDIVNNTANDQGKQVTNLKGETDSNAFDVFIDDYGIIIGVTSFDVLPVYPSGVDACFRMSDRYSLFNPMLQNVGDQPILNHELSGNVSDSGNDVFAYTVRYAQYKFGITRAHGAFVNSLPGFSMLYPYEHFVTRPDADSLRISPDFIRDKPWYFDQFFASRTGMSPGTYYHFIMPVMNQHTAARKMQYQPPVL